MAVGTSMQKISSLALLVRQLRWNWSKSSYFTENNAEGEEIDFLVVFLAG